VEKAHQHDVKVMISLAGGAQKPEWRAAWVKWMKPWNRKQFVNNIVQYTQVHQLDGVDLDLEWKHVDENYSGFAIALGQALRAHGKLFSAALPGKHRYPQISNKALQSFDFINLMAYDLTGPWAPKQSGPHAPYSFALSCIKYWKKQGVPAERLILGLPLYGWDFTNPKDVHSVNYKDIVRANPGYAHLDQVGRLYYNGLLTTTAKVELALEQAGGVMLWELSKDSFDEFSLLKAVHQTVHGIEEEGPALPIEAKEEVADVKSFVGPLMPGESEPEGFGEKDDIFSTDELKLNINVVPNPFKDSLLITNLEGQLLHLVLTNRQGQILFETSLLPNASISWETASFPSGYYTLSAMKGNRQLSRQLVKQLLPPAQGVKPRDAVQNLPKH
jgi:chitinase